MPTTTYSAEEYDEIRERHSNMMDIFNQIFESFSDEHKRRFRENTHYPFIPRSSYGVISHLQFLNKFIKNENDEHCLRFLDVGCDAGNVLLLANAIFRWPMHAWGIERDRKLCLMARQFVGSCYDSEYVFNMDAFNFKKYHKFDIIYYYCPIANHELQKKLELLIEKKMKVGAYLIPFLKQDKSFTVNGNFKRINKEYEIYVKKK